jgi:hypothetical protein
MTYCPGATTVAEKGGYYGIHYRRTGSRNFSDRGYEIDLKAASNRPSCQPD